MTSGNGQTENTQRRVAGKCSVIRNTVIIAGGWARANIISTEIINITKKTIKFGGDLSTGHYEPSLVTFNYILHAIGGSTQDATAI